MSSNRLFRGLMGVIVVCAPGVASGQSEEPFHHLTLSGGVGLTTITGLITGNLDHGGTFR